MTRTWKGARVWLIIKLTFFGFLFIGDGATISRNPLLKIFVSGKIILVYVLEIDDCQFHLSDCGKKIEPLYVIYLSTTWKHNPNKIITDVVIFDGASNVQIGGELMKINEPKFNVMCVV